METGQVVEGSEPRVFAKVLDNDNQRWKVVSESATIELQ